MTVKYTEEEIVTAIHDYFEYLNGDVPEPDHMMDSIPKLLRGEDITDGD